MDNLAERTVVMPTVESAEKLRNILKLDYIFMSSWYALSDILKRGNTNTNINNERNKS